MSGRPRSGNRHGRPDSSSVAEESDIATENCVHVIPVADLITHEEQGTGCVCMPRVEYLITMQGAGKLVMHHALDGREQYEHQE